MSWCSWVFCGDKYFVDEYYEYETVIKGGGCPRLKLSVHIPFGSVAKFLHLY